MVNSDKKICIIGKFADDKNIIDGQTVKCTTIYETLKEKFGNYNVIKIDTFGWKKKSTWLLKTIISAFKQSDDIIMLPAHNGLKVFGPLLSYLNKIYNKKLHYVVIGSWLYEHVKDNRSLQNALKKFDGIYVETSLLEEKLKKLQFNNVYIMSNYKKINIISLGKAKNKRKCFKICTFSRINEQKGITDAINVVRELQEEGIKLQFDIYGQIDKDYKNTFENLLKETKNIKYKGLIAPQDSPTVLKEYNLLIFPTKYKTEGIPGTIIDSYASGVPVLASKWENYNDLIDENQTGILFEFEDINDFKEKLLYAYNNQEIITNMKKKCIEKAKKYCSVDALKPLLENIEKQ